MAFSTVKDDPKYLRAIVDMGSNGIRFSISSLQPPTDRIMPTLYQHRIGISLYDAQYSASGQRQPIDDQTTKSVITAMKRFQTTCMDFQVPKENIAILATEATRTASNSEDFRRQIKDSVGWDVTMLPKEEEGRIGAFGIASSLPSVDGLVMDLGGGSTQLSWLTATNEGEIQMPSSGAVSMPYGAAAMMRRLTDAEGSGTTQNLKAEIMKTVKEAYDSLDVPNEQKQRADAQGGFTLYLSGGGFRGWGYILMSRQAVQPYPIPTINGFKASRKDFMGIENVKMAATAQLDSQEDDIFRVSDRRASQVPAVAFLINALGEALPQIKEVRFCQGGVREGYLFASLSPVVRAAHPLDVATSPFSPESPEQLFDLIRHALPDSSGSDPHDKHQTVFETSLIWAFVRLMYYHSSHSKDLQASAALRSTTSGALASVHGVLHEHRALLALLLCSRWGGEVPPTDVMFKHNLEQLIESPWTLWWVQHLGAVAAFVAAVFPAGVCNVGQSERLGLKAKWNDNEGDGPVLFLQISFGTEVNSEMFAKETKAIDKIGKKKNWIGGKGGIGYKVVVESVAAGGVPAYS